MTRDKWFRELLVRVGAPVTTANRRAGVSWLTTEGSGAPNNPLATTLFMPGSETWNSAGVKSYATIQDGLTATQMTLEHSPGHDYHAILHRLRENKGAKPICEAIGASDWGTDGELLLRVLDDVREDLMGPLHGSHEIARPATS